MNYKERFKAKGLKMTWFADLRGIKQSTFSAYINGKRTMPESLKNELEILLR